MLNIEELVKATKGILRNGNSTIIPERYEIDSREIKQGDFFIPIQGEKVDAHEYIIDCVKKGAVGFFIMESYPFKEEMITESIKLNADICIIEVIDTLQALIESGKYNRQKHIDIPVVAITGSVGKTSTREMIASVLKQEKNILVTQKNYNSNIGTSIMCLQIDHQDVCVLEAGIDKFGEMEELSEILRPDVVVITLIGTSHIGTFLTKENIFTEKTKLVQCIKGMKQVITNGDDIYLSTLISNDVYTVEKVSIDMVGDIENKEESLQFETRIYGGKTTLTIHQIGNHNIYNALLAIKVGEAFQLTKEHIIEGISQYKNFKGRMQKIEIEGITLIDDTYNASNESMRSGLLTINRMHAKRKIAVLGDMFDLGDSSDEIHEKLGEVFETTDYDYLFTLGDQMKKTAKEAAHFMKEKNILMFDERDELIVSLLQILQKGDLVYFKASNGMKFTTLLKEVEKRLQDNIS